MSKDRALAHDAFSALAKLKTIWALMKDANPDEIKDTFLPMAGQVCEEMEKILEKTFAEEKK